MTASKAACLLPCLLSKSISMQQQDLRRENGIPERECRLLSLQVLADLPEGGRLVLLDLEVCNPGRAVACTCISSL